MSFTISIYGHGAEPDDVRAAFDEAIRALRGATPEGGSLGGTCNDGTGGALRTDADVSDEAGDDSDEASQVPEPGEHGPEGEAGEEG